MNSILIVEERDPLIIDDVTTLVLEVQGFVGQGPPGTPGQSGSPRVVDVPFASSLTINWHLIDEARVALTADCTVTLTGANDGQKCVLTLEQDGTGGHVATFGAEVRYGLELPSIAPSIVATKASKLGFIFDVEAGKYDFVAQLTGF